MGFKIAHAGTAADLQDAGAPVTGTNISVCELSFGLVASTRTKQGTVVVASKLMVNVFFAVVLTVYSVM